MAFELKIMGLVNSDIKPSNMMLDKNGDLFMIDIDPIREFKPDKISTNCAVTIRYLPNIQTGD